jgi:hypothetical protein
MGVKTRREKFTVLVRGLLDVVALPACEAKHEVATWGSLGTLFTEDN